MSTKAGFLVFGVKLICGLIMGFSSLFAFMIFGPRLESTYFPVVERLQNVRLAQNGDDVVMTGTMAKLRNCEYIGTTWNKVDSRGVTAQLRYINLTDPGDSPPTRPVGVMSVGPTALKSIHIDDLKSNVYAEIVHRCHPMWLTTSALYP